MNNLYPIIYPDKMSDREIFILIIIVLLRNVYVA